MNKITFEVTLEFAFPIKGQQGIEEVQQNVLNALTYHADTAGLAPEDGEAYTKAIKVFEPLTQRMIGKLL